LDDVRRSKSNANEVVLSFTNWSSVGLRLQDVHAKNIDGSDNSCTLCCKGAPPFEILLDAATSNWTTVSEADTKVTDSTVTLQVDADVTSSSTIAVRYAWRDYVECVLVNNDGLPLSPFRETVAQPPARTPAAPHHVVAHDVKQPTPPMGFNSWNFYHCNIDERTVMGVIDAIASNGMKEAGYEYVNIDDCWQVERFANDTIQPDPVRFPSGMKSLADYAHAKGLKFGVYTARGSKTCQNRPGAYNHEEIDAKTYCDWGLDYLKNDNCGGSNWPQENTSWIKFQQGFDECYAQTGRYIVKSIEYCKDPNVCGQWIGGVANTWRTVGDVQATWSSVLSNIHNNNKMASVVNNGQAVVNGQGNFNDADMLEVGNVGLSFIEQQSHMALWSLAGSPLLAGTDIIHATNETLSILANKEVTAINQDLGFNRKIQGILVNDKTKGVEVWAKQLADGKSVAVILLNLGEEKNCYYREVGRRGPSCRFKSARERPLGAFRSSRCDREHSGDG
jgi:alpha-galactosidase